MRETDLNRLRTLCTNLNGTRDCQSSNDSRLSGSGPCARIVSEMEEVELLWEMTAVELSKQSYQCNYDRTIRGLLLS